VSIAPGGSGVSLLLMKDRESLGCVFVGVCACVRMSMIVVVIAGPGVGWSSIMFMFLVHVASWVFRCAVVAVVKTLPGLSARHGVVPDAMCASVAGIEDRDMALCTFCELRWSHIVSRMVRMRGGR